MRFSIEDYDDVEGKTPWCVVDHEQTGSDGEELIVGRYATRTDASIALEALVAAQPVRDAFPHYTESIEHGDIALALSYARTALDEGYVDGVNEPALDPETSVDYAIQQIDAAMNLVAKQIEAVEAKVTEQDILRKRLWFMYLPRFEDTWETLTNDEVVAAWETLTDDEKDAAHEQWSSETFEEADTLDGIQAGLEMALAIIRPPVDA